MHHAPMQSVLAPLAAAMTAAAIAAPVTITLPASTSTLRPSTLPGYTVAQEKCGICHSADYIRFQPPDMTLAQWTAEMTKMQQSYGAPITDEQVRLLGAYLAVTYGNTSPTDPAVLALTRSAPSTPNAPSANAGVPPAVQALLTANGCLGCHAVDTKVVGPAFKDVAAKYKSDPQAVATVAARIRSGGSGLWGSVPMPPMASLSPSQAETLARYVLAR